MMNLNILLMMLINKVSICLQEDMFSEHFDISSSSLRPLRIRPGPPVCSGLGKNGVRRGRHLIHTEYTAPLSGRCSKLPRAGVILPQIIPKGMWGPENVKFKIT